MVLYGVTGKALELDADVWRQLLAAATSHGWRSMGTTAPPRAVLSDPAQTSSASWTGDYTQPQGQEVTRRDAAALACSLRAFAASAGSVAVPATLNPFLEICDHGGFVICAGVDLPIAQTEASDSAFSHSLARLAINLGAAVPPRASSVQVLRNQSEAGIGSTQNR